MTSMALLASRMAALSGVDTEWFGKCLDLSKAYKQLPLLDSRRKLCVILVADGSGNSSYYISNSLIFGSTAAVFHFNRVSRSYGIC